jgi:peptidoglycan/xylan/chitin deacetylase (PgdA/CDA1 family)
MTIAELVSGNDPASFWRLADELGPDAWEAAALAASSVLPPRAQGRSLGEILALTLGEGQFGPDHWTLPGWLRVYYRVKSRLPRAAVLRLRRAQRQAATRALCLGWPIEDRYRRFLWDTAGEALRRAGRADAAFAFFWPRGHAYAVVLTHDIETAAGQEWAARVADLEERLGVRSAFNFVSDDYPLDHGLIRDLQGRGFEVGVHGLRHDGHEFSSRHEFERRAEMVNRRLRELGAVGFRAPLTHRHPGWMQSLGVEYDASFFDTDPFEPIPGGTMSLWPFLLGRFVELPYTLPQDHTLAEVLGERTPALWLTKTSYLARWFGMALVNAHPDYLRLPGRWAMYEEFLETVLAAGNAWRALPRDVARWWRRRATAPPSELLGAPDVAMGRLRLEGGRVEVSPPEPARL